RVRPHSSSGVQRLRRRAGGMAATSPRSDGDVLAGTSRRLRRQQTGLDGRRRPTMGHVALLILQVGPVFAMDRLDGESGPSNRIAERSWPRARRKTAGGAGWRSDAGSGVVSRGAHPRRRLLLAEIWPVVAEKRKA